MRNLLFVLQKEFIQIFRSRILLPMIIVVPVIQLVILVHAANLEMKNIRVTVVDLDGSPTSRRLVNKFSGSPFFQISHYTFSLEEAEDDLKANHANMILHIPHDFERKLIRENHSELQILINAINATAAGLTNAYALSVVGDFNLKDLQETSGTGKQAGIRKIIVSHRFWYNPELNYKTFMFPGILVLLVTMIGMILTALNLVREKEIGTAEQINVTPIRKYQFIMGKLLPFWVLALAELSIGLLIGRIFFRVPVTGSYLLLLLFASLYLLAVMGIGLFISTVSRTQIQVMFVAFFFMITFIMMSGIFTPAESMPDWAIRLNFINPVAYFMRVIRMILLKGSEMGDIIREVIYLGAYAVVVLSLAVVRYRKTA
jgi:ABC-2 type transport system permease protein